MAEWKEQLDRAQDSLSNPSEAFLKAFGALEICFTAVTRRFENIRGGTVDDRFAQTLRLLAERRLLTREEHLLASHIAAARNLVAHGFGFEPSSQEVRRTIKNVERLCARFGKIAHEVMIHPVITATREQHVSKFVPHIVNDGISYIPVVGENKVIGTLTDLEVLKAWEKGDGILDPDTPVEKLMTEKVLPEVRADLSIEEVRKVMLKQKTLAVLVLHAGLPQGILTRFDLLEHVGTDM